MTTIDPDVSRALAGCGCTAEQAGEALATGMRPALERLALPTDMAERMKGIDLDLTGAHLEEV